MLNFLCINSNTILKYDIMFLCPIVHSLFSDMYLSILFTRSFLRVCLYVVYLRGF